jgi:hypothetical protein
MIKTNRVLCNCPQGKGNRSQGKGNRSQGKGNRSQGKGLGEGDIPPQSGGILDVPLRGSKA